MKRIVSMILALTMCICMIPTVSAASDLPFTDVPVTEWYYNDVKTAFESGLINGKSATTYEPESLLLYCEAVKLAACMHQKYTAGTVTLGNGTPQWYSSYVDYAILNSIISKEYAWESHATRAGYMEIFASALPDEALPVINNVPAGSIPDVPVHHPQAAAIYKLYRAGILQGSDAVTHICKPDDNIKRSEVAAILTRMMNPEKRVKFSMGDPLTITTQPKDNYDGRPDVEAEFTVKASGGKAPYTYQWQWMRGGKWENPTGYLSAKTDTFAMSLTIAGDTVVELRCIVTDADGDTVTSEIAHFQVPKSDLSVDMLSSNTVKADETVLFTVDAVTGGVAPYSYKWMYDVDKDYMFKDIPGAADSKDVTFKFTEAELDKGIRIVLEVTDADGNKVTKFCQLVKLIPEFRLAGSTKLDITHGSFNIANVYANGGKEPYTYKWQYKNPAYDLHKDWTDVHKNYGMGSVFTGLIDSNQLMVTGNANTFVNGMLLRCIVTDADGKQLTTNEIPVTVNVADLKVESLPANIVVDHLENTKVSAKVSGGMAPYTYDWYVRYTPTSAPVKIYNGGGMQYTFTSGIGTADLTFVPAYNDSTNGMLLWCEITDSKGTKVTTDYAKVTVREPAQIQITQNLSAAESMIRGYDQTLHVKASGGSGKLSYAWQYNTGSGWKNCTDTTYFMKGYTSDTLSIVPTLESYVNGAKFRCVISDQGGQTVYSNETKLTVKERMDVLADLPESAEFNLPTKSSSDTLTFTVSASNSVGKLDYIWQYKDASNSSYRNITAAQNWATINGNTITIRATRALTDTYPVVRCVFQDELAQNAWTTGCRIEPKNVFITKQPQNVSVSARGTNAVSFDVEVDGGLAPYTYQWEFTAWYDGNKTLWESYGEKKFGITNGLKNSFINVNAGDTLGKNVAMIDHFAARVTVRDAQGSKVTSSIAFLLP